MAVRQRRLLGNYLEVNSAFELMGTGFTDLNESPSAQTTSKRYVNDKSATKSITGYDWSTAFTGDQIRSIAVIDFICNIGEKQLTGADCETNYVMVSLDKAISGEANSFEARKIKVAIEVSSFGNEDGEMTAEGNLLGIGDIAIGKFNTETKTFTEGDFTGTLGVLTVTSVAGNLSGKTDIEVTPVLTVGNTYVYKTAATVTLPVFNEVLTTGYTAWNSTSDITATTGNEILIVEIDSASKAKKAGKTTVTSKV